MKFFKHSGNLIILGFILLAVGMVIFSLQAMYVKVDMAVEGDYYQEETKFDHQLQARQEAENLGKAFEFKNEDEKLTLKIPSHLAKQMENGKVEFFCLSDATFDTKKDIYKNENGKYYFSRKEVARGHNYIVKVSFHADGNDYYKEFRML